MTRIISLNSLKARGWTPRLVETLLGPAIRRAPNPYFPVKGGRMYCFDFDEAVRCESDPRFQLHQIRRARRKEAKQMKGVNT